MEYVVRSGNLAKARTQCIVVPVYQSESGPELLQSAVVLNKASRGQISKILKRGDMQGKAGQNLLLHDVQNVNAQRILIVGLGKRSEFDISKFITVCRGAINRIKSLAIKNVFVCITEADCEERTLEWKTVALIEHFEAGLYQYQEMKGTPGKTYDLEHVDLLSLNRVDAASANAGILRGQALARGISLAKDVANTPSNICTPAYLADRAFDLSSKYKSITVSVLEEKDMEKLGMGAFLSVCHGSEEPGKLITIQYQGTEDSVKPHALIGKGITFDTGGISLKSAPVDA